MGLILAALAGGLVGCGAHAHEAAGTEIDWRPEARKLAGEHLTLPPEERRLVIGAVALPPAGAAPGVADALPLDAGALRATLRDLLRASGAFDEVVLAEDDRGPGPHRGLALEMRLAAGSLRRVRAAESAPLAIGKWFFLGWIADWQHDECFELALAPEFVVSDLETGAPFADIAARPAKAEDALSLFERRSGPGGVAATVCWWPALALDSDAPVVARSLAPACLAGPLRELLDGLAGMRVGYRLGDPVVRADAGMRFELVSPAPNTVLDEPRCGLEFAVTVRPEVGRPQRVIVAGHEVAARGPRVSVRVPALDLVPGRALDVTVVLDDGTPVPLASIPVAREAARVASLGPAPAP